MFKKRLAKPSIEGSAPHVVWIAMSQKAVAKLIVDTSILSLVGEIGVCSEFLSVLCSELGGGPEVDRTPS